MTWGNKPEREDILRASCHWQWQSQSPCYPLSHNLLIHHCFSKTGSF
ncbi:hypothetical protein DDI_1709 [Dickeya dianthicola RNS04.9]|nr:hypothetical protein DDI_1709 [Dickeya dianthicola RNS04.9]